jgi:hypothetical protein
LTLANGDTLTVKKRLSSGEQRAVWARMYHTDDEGTLRRNPFTFGLATLLAYLVDWSLTDDQGDRVVIRGISADDLTAILDALTPEDFAEIKAAVDAHEVAMVQERADAKKNPSGETGSSPTSPSPSAPV